MDSYLYLWVNPLTTVSLSYSSEGEILPWAYSSARPSSLPGVASNCVGVLNGSFGTPRKSGVAGL